MPEIKHRKPFNFFRSLVVTDVFRVFLRVFGKKIDTSILIFITTKLSKHFLPSISGKFKLKGYVIYNTQHTTHNTTHNTQHIIHNT